MKLSKKMTVLACSAALFGQLNTAAADIVSDSETVFNWAEKTFPTFFPNPEATKVIDGWRYRLYTAKGVYAGINVNENAVYVLGGPFGNNPQRVESLARVLDLARQAVAENAPACDTVKAPAGIGYVQNGNNLKVTTSGQCVAVPKSAICNPQVNNKTGISVLSATTVKNFSFKGLTFLIPAFEPIITPTIRDAISVKTCQINVPNTYKDLNIELDVCFDVSNNLKDLPSIASALVVTPPVTMQMQSTITNTVVPDCFATDAAVITDAFTNEVWTKVNGKLVKSPQ